MIHIQIRSSRFVFLSLALLASLSACNETPSTLIANQKSLISMTTTGTPVPAAAKAIRKGNDVEIGDIIKEALLQQNDGGLDWTFMARENTPIAWSTAGIDYNFQRQGTALLAVDGFIPEVLDRTVRKQKWKITESGNKFGVQALHFTNDACFGSAGASENCIERLSNTLRTLELAAVRSEIICKFNSSGGWSIVHKVSIPTKPPAYLHESISQGSGGSYLTYSLVFLADKKASQLENESVLCGVIFADYMVTSSLGIAYKDALALSR